MINWTEIYQKSIHLIEFCFFDALSFGFILLYGRFVLCYFLRPNVVLFVVTALAHALWVVRTIGVTAAACDTSVAFLVVARFTHELSTMLLFQVLANELAPQFLKALTLSQVIHSSHFTLSHLDVQKEFHLDSAYSLLWLLELLGWSPECWSLDNWFLLWLDQKWNVCLWFDGNWLCVNYYCSILLWWNNSSLLSSLLFNLVLQQLEKHLALHALYLFQVSLVVVHKRIVLNHLLGTIENGLVWSRLWLVL